MTPEQWRDLTALHVAELNALADQCEQETRELAETGRVLRDEPEPDDA